MRYCVSLFISLLLLFSNSCFAAATNKPALTVPVLIAQDVMQQLERLQKAQDILTLSNFADLPQGRDLVDVILLNQALELGGCDCKLTYHASSVYGRNIELLKNGSYAMSVDTLWQSDITQNANYLFASSAVINNGEYDVGLYTGKNNNKALNAKDDFELARLTAVSNRFWTADWQTVQALNPLKLAHIESFPSMVRLVRSEIADYTLMHFRVNQQSLDFNDLTPIKQVKAVLWDSRHFAISRNHPQAHHLKQALDKGLTVLRSKKRIKQAYQSVGINHPLTQDWTVINAKIN